MHGHLRPRFLHWHTPHDKSQCPDTLFCTSNTGILICIVELQCSSGLERTTTCEARGGDGFGCLFGQCNVWGWWVTFSISALFMHYHVKSTWVRRLFLVWDLWIQKIPMSAAIFVGLFSIQKIFVSLVMFFALSDRHSYKHSLLRSSLRSLVWFFIGVGNLLLHSDLLSDTTFDFFCWSGDLPLRYY